jgi:hypothetical protein
VEGHLYSGEDFALVLPGKGRNEVLGDLETLRADIEDFSFPLHPKAPANGKGEATRYPTARWSLTVTVGVAEPGEKRGGPPDTVLLPRPLAVPFTVAKGLVETPFRNSTTGSHLLALGGGVSLAC